MVSRRLIWQLDRTKDSLVAEDSPMSKRDVSPAIIDKASFSVSAKGSGRFALRNLCCL